MRRTVEWCPEFLLHFANHIMQHENADQYHAQPCPGTIRTFHIIDDLSEVC